jgi:hypothetical protein
MFRRWTISHCKALQLQHMGILVEHIVSILDLRYSSNDALEPPSVLPFDLTSDIAEQPLQHIHTLEVVD